MKGSSPYKDLHIYHILGKVSEMEERGFGEYFIGNWVEENTSFLFFSNPSYETVLGLLNHRKDLQLLDDYRLTYEQWQGDALRAIEKVFSSCLHGIR